MDLLVLSQSERIREQAGRGASCICQGTLCLLNFSQFSHINMSELLFICFEETNSKSAELQ